MFGVILKGTLDLYINTNSQPDTLTLLNNDRYWNCIYAQTFPDDLEILIEVDDALNTHHE
jgi:hypothetical protein